MRKKASNIKGENAVVGSLSTMTLSEESSGKRRKNINAKSMLKLEHIRNVAFWAGVEASTLPLNALFGYRLAVLREALGSQHDSSLFSCEKCESVLQPGHNCTVRIRKKGNNFPQNYVVYMCHFCSRANLKRGTLRHHMKTICPQKPKPLPKLVKLDEVRSTVEIASVACDPSTPLVRTGMSLLEAKSRKRTRSKKKVNLCEIDFANEKNSVDVSIKRRRKSWTSLKELAESSRKLSEI